MLNKEQQKRIADTLTERFRRKGRSFHCPMCGHDKFVLLDSYLRNDIIKELDHVTLGGPSVPAAAIICENCGFISQHALGSLNLLPQKKEPAEKPEKPTTEPEKQTGGA